jgi:two-component system sensor histidine kinase QseC
MTLSLRHRLTRDLLVATLCLGGLAFASLYLVARFAVRDQFDLAIQARAVAISSNTSWHESGLHLTFDERNVPSQDDDQTPDYYQLTPAGGGASVRSASLKSNQLPVPGGLLGNARFWNLRLPSGLLGRAIAFRFTPSGPFPAPPEVTLMLAVDREDLDETYYRLNALFALGSLLAVGAIFGVVPRVLRRGLAPLDTLGAQVARIDAASLSARLPADDLPVELLPIRAQLNRLLSRLEASFARERRFGADLAHELRTPISELRLLAECALKWPEKRDASSDRETLAIACQLEGLVTRLLELARSENGRIAVRSESVELSALIALAWRPYATRAAALHLRVELELHSLVTQSDALLLGSILGNLFDNAVEYSHPGGVVHLSLSSSAPENVSFAISNQPAIPLTQGEVDQLFDPFWRQESARSDARHSGLGLALARGFAEALGWTLSAKLDTVGRLTFVLENAALTRNLLNFSDAPSHAPA